MTDDELSRGKTQLVLDVMARLAAGDLDARVPEDGGEESIDRIAAAVNHLAQRFAEAIAQQAAAREKLERELERRTAELVQELWATNAAQGIIDQQEDAIRNLTTPTLPIWPDVVVMPLVGSVDAVRGEQVVEQLPRAVAAHQASVAIIDLTGVPFVDEAVAYHLLNAIRAVRLLGGRVILTGAGRENARALAMLGVDQRYVTAKSSLQAGLREAMRIAEHGMLET